MRLAPAAVVVAALSLYVATVSPGLGWGDSAKFQLLAFQGETRYEETGHPVWVLLVHPLTRIPGLDPALACNLASALLSALALWPAFEIMRRLGASDSSAAIACLALAVSHTFWFHAVITEVYALNSVVMLGLLEFVTRPLDPRAPAVLRASSCLIAGVVAGVAAGNHGLVLLWVPGLAWYGWCAWKARRVSGRAMAGGAVGFAAGLGGFVLLRLAHPRAETIGQLAMRLAQPMFHPADAGRDLFRFAAYLLYQFPLPVILLAVLLGAARAPRKLIAGLALCYAASVAFAFSFEARDRFAFYLPSYLALILPAGAGLDRLIRRLPLGKAGLRVARGLLTACCVVAPPVFYHVAPRMVGGMALASGPAVRSLPQRDPARFYLDPNKRGDDGASRFSEAAFGAMPPGSAILADYTPAQPLAYRQKVQGWRADVEITYRTPQRQLDFALDRSAAGRAVFVAATGQYYDDEGLATRFEIVPAGPIYRLVPR